MAFELTLPVSQATIEFHAPRGVDQQTVRQKFMDEKTRGPGESELLAAYCLTLINGQKIVDPSPKFRMESWDLVDVQFFQGVFLEAFYLTSEEWAERARAAAQQVRDTGDTTIVLPTGKKLFFRRPRNADRYNVLKAINENENGPRDIELLASVCVETLDGNPANNGLSTTDPWDLRDIQFYQAVFGDLFFLTAKSPEANQIKEAAKKLLSTGSEATSA